MPATNNITLWMTRKTRKLRDSPKELLETMDISKTSKVAKLFLDSIKPNSRSMLITDVQQPGSRSTQEQKQQTTGYVLFRRVSKLA